MRSLVSTVLTTIIAWFVQNALLFEASISAANANPNAQSDKIVLGTIFEQGSEEIQSAFKFAILTHNQNVTARRFELQAFVDVINTADAFKLSRLICGQFSRGIHSLIAAVSPDSFDTLHSYSNTFQVPFITPWFPEKVLPPSSRLLDHALSMRPEYHQAVIDTINFYGWKKIIFIYETDDGLLRLQQLYQKMRPGENTFRIDLVRKIRTVPDAMSFLSDIETVDRWSNKYIVLDCSTEMAKEIVISHVRSVPLGKRTYHYLLSGLVMDDRWESEIIEYGAINITGFRIVDDDRAIVKDFLKDWTHFDIASKDRPRQSISAEAALMHDAVYVLVEGFGKLLRKKPDIFRSNKKSAVNNNNNNNGLPSTLSSSSSFSPSSSSPSSSASTSSASGTATAAATATATPNNNNGNNNGSVIDCTANKGWITPWEYGDKISRVLRKVEIEGLTGDIRFNEAGRRENYTLHVVEMTVKSAMVKIAEWSERGGFKVVNAKYERLPGPVLQKNKTYIVTTILDEPYIMMKKARNGETLTGNDRYEGYCKDLADLISKTLNINYELVLVKDGKFGSENTQAKAGWDGMIGELIRNEADMAIAPLTITAERERVVDFTKPFASVGISIMMKKPMKSTPNVLSFLEPLSKEVWLCVIFSFIAVSIVLFIVSRFSSSEWHLISPQDQQYYRIYQNRFIESPTSRHSIHGAAAAAAAAAASLNPTILINDFSILNCFWFSIGSLLQQGCNLTPRSLSGRIVSAVWWLFALFLLASYTANLAAFFTIQRIATNVNSAEDLVTRTDIEYGTVKDGSIWNFFKKSQVPLYNKMWEFMNSKKSVLVRSYEEGIQKVRNSKGKYAFLMDSMKNDYVNGKHPCDTVKIGRHLHNEGYGIATPIGSPLRESVNYAVLSLVENGELAKLENRWWTDETECAYTDQHVHDVQNALSLTHVAGVFYVLIGGLIFAMTLALIEFCYKSRSTSFSSKIMFEQMSFHDAMKSKPKIMVDHSKYENMRKKEILHQYYGPASHLSLVDGNQILDNSHTEV